MPGKKREIFRPQGKVSHHAFFIVAKNTVSLFQSDMRQRGCSLKDLDVAAIHTSGLQGRKQLPAVAVIPDGAEIGGFRPHFCGVDGDI